MNKRQITITQNTLKRLCDALITKKMLINPYLDVSEETPFMQRSIKDLNYLLEMIKKEL
jgi:hypothetical protein